MDSNNNGGRRRPRNTDNTRHRSAPDNSTRIGKARIIWGNLLNMIDRRGPQFLILLIGCGVAAVIFGFLAKATARTGGFFYGMWTVLAVISKYAGALFFVLGIVVFVRNIIHSFDGDGIETPEKGLFKKFHQLQYELFDGVNDTNTNDSPRRRRRPRTDDQDEDDAEDDSPTAVLSNFDGIEDEED